jgi:hypothetical protein
MQAPTISLKKKTLSWYTHEALKDLGTAKYAAAISYQNQIDDLGFVNALS